MLDDEPQQRAEDNDDFGYLVTWYQDIRNRQARGQRYEPIELQAILAYEHFLAKVDIEMTAFDWEMLFRLDAEWMQAVPKTPEESKAENAARRRATRH